jgi:DNA-directed RNA polymerase subunit RPC12/RpoP
MDNALRCPGCGAGEDSVIRLAYRRTRGWFKTRGEAEYRCLECAALFRLTLADRPPAGVTIEQVVLL